MACSWAHWRQRMVFDGGAGRARRSCSVGSAAESRQAFGFTLGYFRVKGDDSAASMAT